ncbi:MAG: bifunctional proline dehydrogenase/L-glutamate gamma-semialdehyde dehydrogenase PutA [Rhizobiaceae bacterium]|nr:bifunctional proline dehydrogenase/L-glutamate gamma-semialdehyde dehydrogenase PutA [Rhizobiaceae bacterium]MCV0408775.1 bifunctional proline dehydrogenase/L-glutamate gamma-semialdehyde dehydrogenase PutA [Rhizobiaceae bacterium]
MVAGEMTTGDLRSIRQRIRAATLADEGEALATLVKQANLDTETRHAISRRAVDLVRAVRSDADPQLMERFLAEYGLSTQEGVALMCLAEALLRVPDADTMDDLIRDKIVPHDWSAHSGESTSLFVNASTWALMLTGRVLDEGEGTVERTMRGMIRRLGEPVIRTAVAAAMREMGEQFVLGRTIDEAVRRGRPLAARGYLYSYDMLGEAARTDADARRYFRSYQNAISALNSGSSGTDIRRNPGISVKLSALHPRYETPQRARMMPKLVERLHALCHAARSAGMGLNVDAEEADRLDISLDVIRAVISEDDLSGWDGFGVVVQAYSPRASHVIDWLAALADRVDQRIMVRLVKGAYWDSEIKRAQVLGLSGYPVFTRKANTDVSYIANARKLLGLTDRLYPQFATHNAHTVAAILAMAGDRKSFEFQRLHGMGEALHEAVRKAEGTRCRIYAPVGAHEDLLAYLVRRLLENGANSSFVHQIVDEEVAPETIARDPFDVVEAQGDAANPAILRPREIFGSDRPNARGYDFNDPATLETLTEARKPFAAPHRWSVGRGNRPRPVVNPADHSDVVGEVFEDDATTVGDTITRAMDGLPGWSARPVAERAAILRRAADLYEANADEFHAICAREAGKTLVDAIAEVREAVDFLRYYAAEAPRAEAGTVSRGAIACISPWNFPLAIFTGQIAAALVTGNAVVAKPAEQTPLIAARAVELLHEAGVPADALQIVYGDGPNVGAPLTADPRIAGVCFTGSIEVARRIERQLAETAAPDAMLIAETGGLNAMIVDSTALPEQAVRDIVASAFQSAGQRCSALRILYVQKDVEEKVMTMLKGAMAELVVGDPWNIETDVGPVIDEEAQSAIMAYCDEMERQGRLIAKMDHPAAGTFVAPRIFRVSGIAEMEREVFGPVLHVATFPGGTIQNAVTEINEKGYGLTFGLHTRIEGRVQRTLDRIRVGNVYVNRNQIGAVVGSQPFGGEGLSGTGPKAGGPNYLRRFRKAPDEMGVAAAGTISAGPVAVPAAPDATAWSGRDDRIVHLRKLLRGKAPEAIAAAAAADFGHLPGPTGEANTLTLHPRGTVLCLGPEPGTLLTQAVQALAAGNAVIAMAPGAPAALQPLLGKKLPIVAVDGTVEADALGEDTVDVVACAAGMPGLAEFRRALAARDGPIVPLVTGRIDPVAYAHERAVCVDTTAAGGNATLLAAS